jgi:hypothetical protein
VFEFVAIIIIGIGIILLCVWDDINGWLRNRKIRKLEKKCEDAIRGRIVKYGRERPPQMWYFSKPADMEEWLEQQAENSSPPKTYHNDCLGCGNLFWTSKPFAQLCPDCLNKQLQFACECHGEGCPECNPKRGKFQWEVE